jgi:single-strand DNA-binding protein
MRTTQSGKPVASFRIAVDRPGQDAGADFVPVSAWEKTAAFVCRYFHKGSMIAVQGTLQSQNYTDKNGQNRTNWGLSVEQAFFPLGKGKAESGNTVPGGVAGDGDLPF